jgi:hypothetical protein
LYIATLNEVTVTELGKPQKVWKLVFFPEGLRAEPLFERPPVHVMRGQALKSLRLVETLPAPALVLRERPRASLRLDEPAYRAVVDWLGRDLLLKLALRGRLGWTIPIGVIFLLSSLPLPGNPEAGVAGAPFSPIPAVLGGALVLQGILSRVWPHRVYLALDALWFLGLAADTVRLVLAGGWSPLWLILGAFQVMLAVTGVRQFRRLG